MTLAVVVLDDQADLGLGEVVERVGEGEGGGGGGLGGGRGGEKSKDK